MAKLGWIGLGDIGLPMARRLAEAGHGLHVYARREASLAPLAGLGIVAAPSPAALAAACDAVLLCVTDTNAVETVVFGADGIASTARAGTLLIDHSTIHPQRSRDFAARLREETGMGWVEAPVSGGRVGAEKGTLAIFAGGEADEIDRARAWMAAYSARVTHVGGPGAGDVAKTCNQAVLCVTLAAWAETINYADRCGADVAKVYDALGGSWSDSMVRQVLVPHMISGDYHPGAAALMLKDMNILGDMAAQTKSPMPMAAMVTQLFRQQIAMGFNDSGPPGLMQIYRDGPWRPREGDGGA